MLKFQSLLLTEAFRSCTSAFVHSGHLQKCFGLARSVFSIPPRNEQIILMARLGSHGFLDRQSVSLSLVFGPKTAEEMLVRGDGSRRWRSDRRSRPRRRSRNTAGQEDGTRERRSDSCQRALKNVLGREKVAPVPPSVLLSLSLPPTIFLPAAGPVSFASPTYLSLSLPHPFSPLHRDSLLLASLLTGEYSKTVQDRGMWKNGQGYRRH